MYRGFPTDVNNTIPVDDVSVPMQPYVKLEMPGLSQYGNQFDGGVPLDNLQNAVHRAYVPDPQALTYDVPNVGSPGRGNPLLYPYSELPNGFMPVFENYSDWLSFSNPSRLVVYVDDLNYRGVSPMELQPLVDAPEPWEQYTPQQRAGGG